MKALAGMLLAVALAVGVGYEANAQTCPPAKRNAKQVATSSTKKTSKSCVCRVTKKKSKGVMKTRSFAGYKPVVDSNREGYIDFRAIGLESPWRASEVPARDPINNGGSLQTRIDGMGGLEPRTITNGMENTMAGSR